VHWVKFPGQLGINLVLLVAENLPNQADLNRSGFDGFAQWCDPFHDKMKAMLREGFFKTATSIRPTDLGPSSSSAGTSLPPTPITS